MRRLNRVNLPVNVYFEFSTRHNRHIRIKATCLGQKSRCRLGAQVVETGTPSHRGPPQRVKYPAESTNRVVYTSSSPDMHTDGVLYAFNVFSPSCPLRFFRFFFFLGDNSFMFFYCCASITT